MGNIPENPIYMHNLLQSKLEQTVLENYAAYALFFLKSFYSSFRNIFIEIREGFLCLNLTIVELKGSASMNAS